MRVAGGNSKLNFDFLNDRPIRAEPVRLGGGFGCAFGSWKPLAGVGASAPMERRCFVEIPLVDETRGRGMLAISSRELVGLLDATTVLSLFFDGP